MNTVFKLTEEQEKKLTKWKKKLNKKEETGAIGGAFTYAFTPTSLGIIVEVIHAPSGEKINLTDYDSW